MRNWQFLGGAVLFFILVTGATMADFLGKSALSMEWVERFQNLSKLNAYAAGQPVHLSNVTLSGWNISGARLPGARFDATEWKGVKLERGELSNVAVRKSKMEDVSFDHSLLVNVTFEDTDLRRTSFYKAKMQRVRFIRCKFNGVNIDETVESSIEISDSKLLSSSLSEGHLVAVIKTSTLKDVQFTDLANPSSLSFEKSEINDIDFSRSVLTRFRLAGSTIKDAAFTDTLAENVELSDSDLTFGMSESKIQNLIISGSHVRAMVFNHANVQKITLRECKKVDDMGFYKATIGEFLVDHCALHQFDLLDANVTSLKISNSTLENSDYSNMKAGTLSLDGVTLKGKLDFTDAHIDRITAKNVTKSPGLNLITTGSNVKFE